MAYNTSLVQSSKAFYLAYLFLVIAGMYPLLAFSSVEIILWVNQLNHIYADYFFYYVTILGDELIAASLVVILLFIRFRAAIALACALFFASGLVFLFKRVLFNEYHRPFKILEDLPNLHIIPFMENYPNTTFPSGHTTLAFTLCTFWAVLSRNPVIAVLLLFAAVLVAYSRMYLFQHFFADVYVGSLFGVLCASFALWLFYFKENALLKNNTLANKSLVKL